MVFLLYNSNPTGLWVISIFIQPEGHQDSQINKNGLTVLIVIAN